MLTADKLKEFSQATLRSETATDEDKREARKAIRRINAQAAIAKGRPKRPQRRDYKTDEAHNQALFDFRSVLDRIALVRECSRVLDDPYATVLRRRNARELLYGKDPEPEPVKAAECQAPDKPPSSRLSAVESAEERARAQAFLDSIGQQSIQPVAPPVSMAQEHVSSKPTSKPERWCHTHAVSLDVCRCDANETCELCLCPRLRCFFPCQNAMPRR